MNLPHTQVDVLHQIATEVRAFPNVGASALFVGDRGTGKMRAAEFLARDLGMPICQVDIRAIIGKYIGETEKNLDRILDAAEDCGAILLFEEADALFGKRSEVKDSHDRYANIEVNHLIQRLEGHRGLVILTANTNTKFDGAFMRRLRFVVRFPLSEVPNAAS